MASLEISAFDPADALELVKMWRASFEFGVGVPEGHSVEDQLAFLRDHLAPSHRLWVARRDGQLVGFLAATTDSIAQLYVRVENIGQGIGTRLLDLAKAESSGSLWLFTFARNERACRFYERHGFVAVAHGFEATRQLPDVKYLWVRDSPVG